MSERLSRPNVFIVNNRWDMSETDSEQEFVEKVKQQHVRFNTDFLVKELKVAGEKTARDRVFFVSAREALLVRESRAKGKGLEGEGAGRSSHVTYTVAMATLSLNNWVFVTYCSECDSQLLVCLSVYLCVCLSVFT